MGRGRARAKQKKVARELKYSSPEIDLDRLQEELQPPDQRDDEPASDESRRDDD